MTGKVSNRGRLARMIGAAGGVSIAAMLALGAPGAMAQEKKAAPKEKAATEKAAPAAPAGGGGAPAGEQVMWVKLCEKIPIMGRDKDGKETREEKGICLTHHERIEGNTGTVLVSAAIRQFDGQDKQELMVMVPLGMIVKAGMRLFVYNKEAWEKAEKNEQVDVSKLTPIKLEYTLCHPGGCTADLEITPDLMQQLKTNSGLMIFSIDGNNRTLAFPVPLTGLTTALAGPPADGKAYMDERRRLMTIIAQRQQAAYEEEMKKRQEAAAAGGAPATGQQQPAAAKATPPPAADKKK